MILRCLATSINIPQSDIQRDQGVKLPGVDTPAKLNLEREIAALVARVQRLEAKSSTVNNQTLPGILNGIGTPPTFVDVPTRDTPTRAAKNAASRKQLINSLGASREALVGEQPQNFTRLSDEELEALREPVDEQSKQLGSQRSELAGISTKVLEQTQVQQQALNVLEVKRVAALERELKKHQQANEAFQKALREIGEIVTAVARGDLSKKVRIHSADMDPEITTFKRVRIDFHLIILNPG
jgi:osomolarity two-component system sensor histidine kinase NIK1